MISIKKNLTDIEMINRKLLGIEGTLNLTPINIQSRNGENYLALEVFYEAEPNEQIYVIKLRDFLKNKNKYIKKYNIKIMRNF